MSNFTSPLLALLLTTPCHAQRPGERAKHLSEWGGIADNIDTSHMDLRDAPDAANVLTDNNRLEVMPGMTPLINVVLASYPVKGVWSYTDANNAKYLLLHASATVYQTDLSASPAFLNNVSVSVDLDVITAFSKVYFNNQSDTPWSWDGTSTAAVAAMPLCKFMEFGHERVYCGNTSTNSSTVDVSSFGSASYWTLPADIKNEPDGPNSFTFQKDDGEQINCLKMTPFGLFVGKQHSTHILKGFDNETYYKGIISLDIGCTDDRLVQFLDGQLVWLAADAFYAWNGSNRPSPISDDIKQRIDDIRQISAQVDSYKINTNADWQTGTISQNGPTDSWDTTTLSARMFPSTHAASDTTATDFSSGTLVYVSTHDAVGAITLSSNTLRDDWDDGDFTANPLWTTSGDNKWTVISGKLRYYNEFSDALVEGAVATGNTFSTGSWTVDATIIMNNGYEVRLDMVIASSGAVQTTTQGYYARLYARSIGVATPQDGIYRLDNGLSVLLSSVTRVDQAQGTTTTYALTFTRSDNGNMEFYVNDVLRVSANDTTYSTGAYFLLNVRTDKETVSMENPNVQFDNFAAHQYKASGTFTSRAFDTSFATPTVGPLNSTFTATGGAAIFYDIRYATSTEGAWDSWSASSDALKLPTPTKRALQYRARFHTDVASKTPTLDDVGFVFASTGLYTSAVQFIGDDITAWGAAHFTTDEAPSGRLLFQTRAASWSFATDDIIVPWTEFANHSVVSHATGSYFQFKSTAAIEASTDTAELLTFTLNWQEGTAARAASLVFDRRYFACVTISTGSTINDSCEIYQRNKRWTRLTGKSLSAMTIYDNQPVGVDGSTVSKVWQIMQPGTANYDTDAIDAFWVTPDFVGFGAGNSAPDPHAKFVLNEIWIDAEPQSGGALYTGYAADKSTVFITTSTILDQNSSYVNAKIPIDATYVQGKYLRLKFSNGRVANNVFTLNAYTLYGEDQARTQD